MAIALVAVVITLTLASANGVYNASVMIATLTSAVQQLQATQNGIEKNIDVFNEHIYFKATFHQIDPTIRVGTVVFNKDRNNTGCAYNPNTGIFTAPRAGFYVFAVQTFPRGRSDSRWELYINGLVALRSRSITTDETNSNYMYPVYLHTGDQVLVRSASDLDIFGENHSFFAGWLLRSW